MPTRPRTLRRTLEAQLGKLRKQVSIEIIRTDDGRVFVAAFADGHRISDLHEVTFPDG